MTHGNLVATTALVMTYDCDPKPSDVYIAYLPSSCMFELTYDCWQVYDCYTNNCYVDCDVNFGYSDWLQLNIDSNKIKKGTLGDASMLKPTLLALVPAILDRAQDGVVKKVRYQ